MHTFIADPSTGLLEGRVALVTGAGRGIGRAIALSMAKAGAEVTVLARSEGDLRVVADAIVDAGGVARLAVCDVTDSRAVETALSALPTHDVIVNGAGANVPQPFLDVDLETFDALFTLNVRALFVVTQFAVRRLRDEGRRGVVVNVSSQMGHVGAPNRSVYCATKHAVEGLTKALGVELAPHGIRVVSVAPTFVETELTRAFFENADFRRQVLESIPLGRLGTPQEIAAAAVFLASDQASLITGTSLLADGGWTAR